MSPSTRLSVRSSAALAAPQTRLLTRTFFARLFESDLMPDGLPQLQLVLWSTIFAGMPTTGYVMLLRRQLLEGDRLILVALSMVAMGVVALMISDNIFPDRRDARILGPLPVPTSRMVAARLTALGRLFLLFATAICVPHSLLFGLFGAGFDSVVAKLLSGLVHLVTVLAACMFVLCGLIAAQCLLLLVVGRRLAQAASSAFQVLFAVALAQLVAFLPALVGALRHPESQSWLAALAFPPTWFFRFYETLIGTPQGSDATLGRVAAMATVVSAVLAIGLYAGSYRYLSRRALEGPGPHAAPMRLWPVAARMRRPTRGYNSPMRTAIRLFAVRTIVRSGSHRMMFAIYAGVALALVLSSAASVVMRNNGAGLWQPGITMLSLPLIFQFLLLVGFRVIAAVPSEPKARWLFRACEPKDRGEAVSATRDTMLSLVVVPTALFALAEGLIFWNVTAALSHGVFCLVVGTAFSELLIARTNKLPFACTYFPGNSRVFTLWPLYILVFFIYTVVLGAIDGALLKRPTKFVIFCGCVTLATWLLAWYRRRSLAAMPGLLFEEEDPDAIFEGFNLSEGLAAAPKVAAHR